MATIAVITDSASDLPLEVLDANSISVVPLDVRLGSIPPEQLKGLDPARFWALCETTPELPETSAPAPGAFRAAFLEALERGCSAAVCVTISSRLSATNQAASAGLADLAEQLPAVVIDSRSASAGQALVVIEAAHQAAASIPLEKIERSLMTMVRDLRLVGVLDTLENLRRGGRIGAAQALLGSVLSIKPVIEVRDGAVEPESRQRTRGRSLRYLAERVIDAGPLRRLAVTHAAAPDLEDFLALIGGVECESDPVVSYMGPVIGAHVGRGAIGVAFWPCGSRHPASLAP